MRIFQSGPCSARVDETGVLFDMSGTPMDQDWHCPLEDLTKKAEILRQSWPEEMLREIFAEAARLRPGLPAEPPPPVPRGPQPKVPSLGRRRKLRTPPDVKLPDVRPPAPAAETLSTVPRGLDLTALQALTHRIAAAARAIDTNFPADLGLLALDSVDVDERSERRSFSAGGDVGVRIVLYSEVRDGIGGPVPYPESASFYAAGLRQGCSIRGTWTGTQTQAEVECPAELRARVLVILSG